MYKVHAPRAELNVQKYTFHLPNLMYKVHVPSAEINVPFHCLRRTKPSVQVQRLVKWIATWQVLVGTIIWGIDIVIKLMGHNLFW